MNGDFLGRGWSFPPRFDPSSASVEMVEQEADIHASLQTLLTTLRGERVMLPLYGCNMSELIFGSLDTRTKTLVIDTIKTAVLYHEPRITIESVRLDEADTAEGLVLVELIYVINATNSRTNFVFPFYVIEGTDLNSTLIPRT
ncbi:MAG: GPW/gp25 family protein [Candidatus Kapabacteria bacterium]|nr:GPW/gp25 family protein [Candidatus Kapabacteria bacterium]